MKKIFFLGIILALFLPFIAAAQTYNVDLALKPLEIFLSKDASNLIKGEKLRVYTYAVNLGEQDASGYVVFYLGQTIIGQSPVSLTVKGVKDEVFFDFFVPNNDFNILAKLISVEPADENLDNNSILSPMYSPQDDNDKDGLGDRNDLDDDNDGVSDADEISAGSDPNKADSDADGVIDKIDAYPLDKTKSAKEAVPEIKPAPKKETVQLSSPQLPSPKIADKKEAGSVPLTAKPSGTKKSDLPAKENKTELVKEFYQSPAVELLKEIKIQALPVNWNTYNFSFSTNLPEIDSEKLDYLWSFSDGKESKVNGPHTFSGAGEYFVTLQAKGPWDNILYDSVTIKIAFFSIYNYWLWLAVLLLAGILFFSRYYWDTDKRQEAEPPSVQGEKFKRTLKQPKKRQIPVDDNE